MTKQRGLIYFILMAIVVSMAAAQFRMQMPRMRGIWDPVVGAGSVYQMDGRDYKGEMEFAVVGTETVGGATGHWLEMAMKGQEGLVVMKHLYVLDGKQPTMKRMIFQTADQPPMELPMNMPMMQMRERQSSEPMDIRQTAERVGAESVTVPAGTFACEHWKAKDGTSEFWVAEKVSPYGVVKAITPGGTMTLIRTTSNAKSKIRGTPVMFDPAEMMRRQNPQ